MPVLFLKNSGFGPNFLVCLSLSHTCQVLKVRLCDIAKNCLEPSGMGGGGREGDLGACFPRKILKIECLRLAENAPVASFNANKSYGSKMTFCRILQINSTFNSCSIDFDQ